MDMMNLTFDNESFDVVLDKATMDVIMTDNKDPWNPSEEVIKRAQSIMDNIYKVLKPDGLFIQITFD